MEDKELVAQIGRLAAEEHKLEEAHVGKGLSPDEAAIRPADVVEDYRQ